MLSTREAPLIFGWEGGALITLIWRFALVLDSFHMFNIRPIGHNMETHVSK